MTRATVAGVHIGPSAVQVRVDSLTCHLDRQLGLGSTLIQLDQCPTTRQSSSVRLIRLEVCSIKVGLVIVFVQELSEDIEFLSPDNRTDSLGEVGWVGDGVCVRGQGT